MILECIANIWYYLGNFLLITDSCGYCYVKL